MSTDIEKRLPNGEILVVEDNASDLKFLVEILTKESKINNLYICQ